MSQRGLVTGVLLLYSSVPLEETPQVLSDAIDTLLHTHIYIVIRVYQIGSNTREPDLVTGCCFSTPRSLEETPQVLTYAVNTITSHT